MTYQMAVGLAQKWTPEIRALRYATWREKKSLPEPYIALIERTYPVEEVKSMVEPAKIEAQGEEPSVPQHKRGGCCGK